MKNSKGGFIIPLLILIVLLVLSIASYLLLPRYRSETRENSVSEQEKSLKPFGEVTLKVGEVVRFDGFSLRLKSVFGDSRCPKNVNCIWAGTLNSEIAIISGGLVSTTTVSLGQSVVEKGLSLKLVSAIPYPEAGTTISPEDYRLVFKVTKQ